MELALCAAAIFVVSAVTVLLVSLVGTRQKTYEEALAEARQRSLEEDAALQQARQHHRRDGCSKKVKGRWGRTKVKESPTEAEAPISVPTLANETLAACPPSPTQGPAQHSPEHVEFKEEAEVVLIPKGEEEEEEPPCDASTRSSPALRNRRPQKPILVHKLPEPPEELAAAAQTAAPLSPKPMRRNSFKDIVPKDEIELKHLQEQQQLQQQQQEVGDGSWAAAKGSPLREKPPRSRRSKGSQDVASAVPAAVATSDVQSSEIGVRELLALVRGARFSAEEEELQQQLVEELLNRAGQQPGAAGEWRKRGPDPEAHLRRQLAERERDLEAERQHTLSHATKVKELRQELNQQLTKVQQQEKSLKAQQKLTEEQAAQLQRLRDDSQQLQQRVQQLEAELQQASASVCDRVRVREEELERSHREALELERQEAEARLAQAREKAEALEGACAQLRQRLDQEAQSLAAQRNASEGKVKELSKVHQLELEAERAEHQRRLDVLEQRVQEQAHLAEELRTRLAEAVQTHSREVSELSRKKAEVEAAAEGAEQRLAQAHEAAVEELRRELDDQRAKNNDLRTKNWEVVEAMRAYERKAEAQAKALTKELEALQVSHTQEMQSLEQRLLAEHEQKERELLERLLPMVKMQDKLKELQAKLQDEEGEKKILEQRCDEVSRNAQDVRTQLESRVRELEEIKQTRDDYDLLKKELAQVKEQLAQAQASPQPTTKVDPSSSPATNGPSAEKEDKLDPCELGHDESARPSGDAPCSKHSNRTKKRVRLCNMATLALCHWFKKWSSVHRAGSVQALCLLQAGMCFSQHRG
ncbi:uncharacterized protein LOC144132260 isoform X21 [Amblyomma americanum]